MATIWVMTANAATATIFTAELPTGPLVEFETFDNPDARAKQMDLASDRPGRSFDSKGEGRHAMEVEVDPKQQVQVRFAKLLADRLEQGRVDHGYERLLLVAAPAFLGLLRPNLGAPLKSLISMELDKDYTSLRPDELRARLPARL